MNNNEQALMKMINKAEDEKNTPSWNAFLLNLRESAGLLEALLQKKSEEESSKSTIKTSNLEKNETSGRFCLSCGVSIPDKKIYKYRTCNECRERKNRAYETLEKNGLCIRCGENPPEEGKKTCSQCIGGKEKAKRKIKK